MTRALTKLRRGEDGFTLIELVVAMGISLVVLMATLVTFDGFTSQRRAPDARHRRQRPGAPVMDRTVADLRGASSCCARAPGISSTRSRSRPATRVQRLCVDTRRALRAAAVTAGTPRGDRPPEPCPSGDKVAALKSRTCDSGNSRQPDCAYDSAIAGDRARTSASRSPRREQRPASPVTSTLRASASSAPLRQRAADHRRATSTRRATRGGRLLSLGVLSAFGPLTVTYTNTDGVALGTPSGSTLQIPAGITNVVATVTNAGRHHRDDLQGRRMRHLTAGAARRAARRS